LCENAQIKIFKTKMSDPTPDTNEPIQNSEAVMKSKFKENLQKNIIVRCTAHIRNALVFQNHRYDFNLL